MFPKARKADLDTAALGLEMAERKAELKDALGIGDEDETALPPPKSKDNGKRRPKARA